MVKEMDPDAPCRTGKKLHDLDMEDENRLLKVRKLFSLLKFWCSDNLFAPSLCSRVFAAACWRTARSCV